MKFSRFLARQSRGFRLLPMSGMPGARQRVFMQMRDRSIVPYRGPFEKHVLLLVREGSVEFTRDGKSFTARATDALLIGRGACGQLTFQLDPDTRWVIIDIIAFDERAIARALRRDAGLESFVVSREANSPTALCFRELERRIPTNLPLPIHRFRAAMSVALNQHSPGLPDFLRGHFYQRRWRLLLFLEGLVTSPEALKEAAAQYEGGDATLRRDCLLYIGTRPEVFLRRRRCELADAWLRCGHSIDDTAKALGFSTASEFECVFAGIMKKRCRDVQKLPPLDLAEPEQLVEALQPFWWEGRQLALAAIPQSRLYPPTVMDEAMEDSIVAHEPELLESREQARRRRNEFSTELREKAAGFFAMKSTGAELIVPIFKSPQPAAKAA